MRLLFQPYETDQLMDIFWSLYNQKLQLIDCQYELLIPMAVFQLAAIKVEKRSGDIRVCFEIIRTCVARKLNELRSEESDHVQLTLDDVNTVCVDLFESKLTSIVKKLPKSHIVLLEEIKQFSGGGALLID
jgi:Cdc6-like AAA superfamily ATPase